MALNSVGTSERSESESRARSVASSSGSNRSPITRSRSSSMARAARAGRGKNSISEEERHAIHSAAVCPLIGPPAISHTASRLSATAHSTAYSPAPRSSCSIRSSPPSAASGRVFQHERHELLVCLATRVARPHFLVVAELHRPAVRDAHHLAPQAVGLSQQPLQLVRRGTEQAEELRCSERVDARGVRREEVGRVRAGRDGRAGLVDGDARLRAACARRVEGANLRGGATQPLDLELRPAEPLRARLCRGGEARERHALTRVPVNRELAALARDQREGEREQAGALHHVGGSERGIAARDLGRVEQDCAVIDRCTNLPAPVVAAELAQPDGALGARSYHDRGVLRERARVGLRAVAPGAVQLEHKEGEPGRPQRRDYEGSPQLAV
ncbi:hypothetical protein T492DRAFT_928671 [Pavlovales sp. CCMP2436]|nr:hypothetical protein T492DRAFT_928671 [Pavlovales sp. CCMP2436]|mmetsp:Transcript_31870/g.73266  ORF Transcript_31870/g.73266 Transcript_31870/m.73266 type:complete len:386 (+) Transcript_31870:521-1678(+)